MKYHKINSIYKRVSKGEILWGNFSKPEFKYLQNNEWIGTEKIHGTNIRIFLDNNKLIIKGRNNVPKEIRNFVADINLFEKIKQLENYQNFIFYFEGVGPKINSNGFSESNLVLFDIYNKQYNYWYYHKDLVEIAKELDLLYSPIIFKGSLYEAMKELELNDIMSVFNTEHRIEGFVLKPSVNLFNTKGERIITKIKYSDLS